MEVGTLVKTTGYGPNGEVGEVGIVIKFEKWGHARVPHVMFQSPGNPIMKIAQAGLRRVEDARKD